MADAFVNDDDHPACGICPSRRLPVGRFDVHERPSKDAPFNAADGHRYTASGVPVCVHPHKVGLAPGNYASDGLPVPAAPRLTLPDDADALVPYLRETLHGAAPEVLEALIEHATTEIPRVHPGVDVLSTLRRALN